MSKLWPVDWKQFLLSAWVLSDLTPPNPTERQGLVSILQRLGRSGSTLSVVRLGRSMARLFCATSADSMAVSLTLCCPSTRETPEIELSRFWKRHHALLHSQLQCHPSGGTSPSPSALPIAGEWVSSTGYPATLGRIWWEGPSQTPLL